MKAGLRSVYKFAVSMGFDPLTTARSLRGLMPYLRDLRALRGQCRKSCEEDEFPFGRPFPCLADRYAQSGSATGHYFWQDLLVAQRVYQSNPRLHVDVGSRIDGFVAHIASFREIEVLDIRPLTANVRNIRFTQMDLTATLDERLMGYCDSLSCLHALEHLGLGRYGDRIDSNGYRVGLRNLSALLEGGGTLYLSVPIGPQRIEFNAHRIFSLPFLLECLEKEFSVIRFSYVDDDGDLHDDVSLDDRSVEKSFDCTYGCGIVEATRRR